MYKKYTKQRRLTKYYNPKRFNADLFEIIWVHALTSWTIQNDFLENDPTHHNILIQLLDYKIGNTYSNREYINTIHQQPLFHLPLNNLLQTSNNSKINWYSSFLIATNDSKDKNTPQELSSHQQVLHQHYHQRTKITNITKELNQFQHLLPNTNTTQSFNTHRNTQEQEQHHNSKYLP